MWLFLTNHFNILKIIVRYNLFMTPSPESFSKLCCPNSRSLSTVTTQTLIKRSPSMNETHYSPVSNVARTSKANVGDHIDDTVYENVSSQNKKTTSSTMTMTTAFSTEKNAMSTQTDNSKPVLQKEVGRHTRQILQYSVIKNYMMQ